MIDKISQQVKTSALTISLHKFRLEKNNSAYVFFFVEGDDDIYYYPQNAKNLFNGKSILTLDCNGKSGVIQANEALVNEITEGMTIGFFVDKDFDDENNGKISSSIYVTPTYSVENLVYNKQTFKDMLTSRFRLTPTDNSFDKCVRLYDSLSEQFYSSVRLYNHWIYAQRNLTAEKKVLNLPKKLPNDFVTFKNDNISANYDLSTIINKHPNATPVTEDIMDRAAEILDSSIPEQSYRGKFNWHFFSHIISILIEDANNKHGNSYLEKAVKFNISRNDPRKLFEEISVFSRAPQCLLDYFSKIAS